MAYTIVYHPKVRDDIAAFDNRLKETIAKAIETRLRSEPQRYGKPLHGSLKGYWKLRIGDIRVVFKIAEGEILILAIINRKSVYESVSKRL